jgi:hypothetical protein
VCTDVARDRIFRPRPRRRAGEGHQMQTFLLAQAVLEHSMLSSWRSVADQAGDQIQVLVDTMGTPRIAVAIVVAVLLMVWLRR